MSEERNGVFGPEAVEAMGRAFDLACVRLGESDPKLREAIAFKIVSAAHGGESDKQNCCVSGSMRPVCQGGLRCRLLMMRSIGARVLLKRARWPSSLPTRRPRRRC